MTYTYRLAGENLELAEAELNGFLESQDINEKASRKDRIAETEAHPSQLKRLALVHEVARKTGEASCLEELKIDSEITGSFAVRAENLTESEINKENIEKEIGRMIERNNNSVDLENPQTVLKAYITEESILLGEVIEDIDRGLFRKRSNEKRPFSSPISMDPVLARVLVNLSGVKPGEHVLDPFCGTGGILIEAGLCGIGVHGQDVSSEMAEGTEKNLEEYGILSHEITEKEVKDTGKTEKYSVLITDLPYGQASVETSEAVQDFLDLITGFDGRTVFMYNEETVGEYDADFSVYIHKNLTRYIFVV